MNKRIFISFAVEDKTLRDFIVGQSKNDNSPFEFVDMSVKTPWDSMWKTNCRKKIKGCDGMIAIITKNTKNADGQLWEINCAKDEDVPILAIWGHPDEHCAIPSEISPIVVRSWTWDNIKKWLGLL